MTGSIFLANSQNDFAACMMRFGLGRGFPGLAQRQYLRDNRPDFFLVDQLAQARELRCIRMRCDSGPANGVSFQLRGIEATSDSGKDSALLHDCVRARQSLTADSVENYVHLFSSIFELRLR